ncbi:MAG: ABC transporter permease [Bdellovibrionales bacterium]|nr:ABC transporter permease [Bdellovibrionales bacterium]
MLSLEFFHRFLLSRRAGSLVRTIARISIVGIWLGVAALVVVMSVMNGFNTSIRSRLLEVEPHLVVNFEEAHSAKDVQNHPAYKDITALGDEAKSHIFASQDVILRTSEGYVQGAVAKGVSKERLGELLDYADRKAGRPDPELRAKLDNMEPGETIFGMGLADGMGLFRGDNVVLIPPESLLMPAGEVPKLSQGTVRGFLLTDIERVDNKMLFYLIDQSFPRLREVSGRKIGVEMWLKDPDRAPAIKGQLQRSGLEIETWEERNASLFFALKVEKLVVSVLVGLSTLIAGFSIISVMVLLLTQKKKDVGNLLAMGMTQSQTRKIFVDVGMFLSLFGVVAGILTGMLLSFVINNFSQDVLPAFYEETNIPAEIRFYQIVFILLFAIGFSFFALNLTMKRLAGHNPSEVLRG